MNVLYPVFTLVALTICVAARLGFLRYRAVYNKEVDMSFYQAYIGEEPARLRIASRHLTNLLELPPLFYIACMIAFVTGQSGNAVMLLAWAYCGLRFVHSFIHLGPNIVIWRFRVFALSVLALTALWVLLFLGLVTA